MLFSVSAFPIGSGASIRKPVSEVVDEIDRSGLHYEVTPMDTIIEGEWDDVMPVLKRAEARLRAHHGRVFIQLTIDDRVDGGDRLHETTEKIERELGRSVLHQVP